MFVFVLIHATRMTEIVVFGVFLIPTTKPLYSSIYRCFLRCSSIMPLCFFSVFGKPRFSSINFLFTKSRKTAIIHLGPRSWFFAKSRSRATAKHRDFYKPPKTSYSLRPGFWGVLRWSGRDVLRSSIFTGTSIPMFSDGLYRWSWHRCFVQNRSKHRCTDHRYKTSLYFYVRGTSLLNFIWIYSKLRVRSLLGVSPVVIID